MGDTGAPRKYPDELLERAIRLAVEARRDPATRLSTLAPIDAQLSINRETLRSWVTQAEVDAGHRPGVVTTAEAQRIAHLEREVRELRRDNDISRWRRRASPRRRSTTGWTDRRYIDARRDRFRVELERSV